MGRLLSPSDFIFSATHTCRRNSFGLRLSRKIISGRAKDLPVFSPDESATLNSELENQTRQLRLRLNREHAERTLPETVERSLEQAPLGFPRLETKLELETTLMPTGRFIAGVTSLFPIDKNNNHRVGTVVLAAVTREGDINPLIDKGPPSKKQTNWLTKLIKGKVLTSWKNLHKKTGDTEGHVFPKLAAKSDPDDKFTVSQKFLGVFPQSSDSNGGAWSRLEQSMAAVVTGDQFYTIDYLGPTWKPITYINSKGKKIRIDPKSSWRNIPRPTGYFRVSLIIPTHDSQGWRLDLASALSRARPIAAIVPNGWGASIRDADWTQFSKTIREVENFVGIEEMFPFLESHPYGKKILHAIKNHKDSGYGLPDRYRLAKTGSMVARFRKRVNIFRRMSRQHKQAKHQRSGTRSQSYTEHTPRKRRFSRKRK